MADLPRDPITGALIGIEQLICVTAAQVRLRKKTEKPATGCCNKMQADALRLKDSYSGSLSAHTEESSCLQLTNTAMNI